jgi:hypothetical protein
MTYEEACAALHVAQGAPVEVAESAYRVLSKQAHPDLGGSTAQMQRLNNAIGVIRSVPPRRAAPTRPATCQMASVTTIRMPWGKFKGTPMNEVPKGYLVWLVENSDNDDVVERAATILHIWAAEAEISAGRGPIFTTRTRP